MFAKKYPLVLFAILAFFVSVACGLSGSTGTPDPQSPDAVYTSVAQTVVAQITQVADGASPTATSVDVQPTSTSGPTMTPLPTFTPVTPLATWTPLPTNTTIPTPTPLPCNWVQFVSDVTVPDGTVFSPGATFLKTWRLKNIGSCTWTTNYDLFFVNGDKLNGDTLVPLTKSVAPGQTIDVSVELTAPTQAGTYLGNWQLRAGDGTTFGIGANKILSFWVKISVLQTNYNFPYSFVEALCKAQISSSAGSLPCPGQTTDAKGFVQVLTSPKLETGKTENEPALWVHPQFTTDGYIQIEYPDFQVYPKDKFISYVGCLYGYNNCKVIFTLSYRDEDGTVKTLGTWQEAYEGLAVPVSIDINSLAGKKVNFILRVDAWGNADADHAFWLNPHIEGDPRLGQSSDCFGCEE